jgi:hypothetical protein
MDSFNVSGIEYPVLLLSISKLKLAVDLSNSSLPALVPFVAEQIPALPCISSRNKKLQEKLYKKTSFPFQAYSKPYYLCFIMAELVPSLEQRNEVLSLPSTRFGLCPPF